MDLCSIQSIQHYVFSSLYYRSRWLGTNTPKWWKPTNWFEGNRYGAETPPFPSQSISLTLQLPHWLASANCRSHYCSFQPLAITAAEFRGLPVRSNCKTYIAWIRMHTGALGISGIVVCKSILVYLTWIAIMRYSIKPCRKVAWCSAAAEGQRSGQLHTGSAARAAV